MLDNKEVEQYIIRCPVCDRVLMKAVVVIEGIIKCEKCHRRYLINIKDDSVIIKLISKPNDNNGR